MRRKATVLSVIGGLVLALAMVLSPTKPASAQAITWTTSIQVQNLGAGQATVTIDLYDRSGAKVASIANEAINTNASKTYFPIPLVSAGFNGSAIISANQPVAAILNVLGNMGTSFYSEAATGISVGATKINLPLIHRGNGGFNTWFAVQNVGTAAATITVAFKAGNSGTDYTTTSGLIAPGASVIFDQETETNLGPKFVGSAIVTSAQPLAAIVNQVGTGSLKESLIYSGFTTGSNSVLLPLVHQSNGGYFTGVSVQNTGDVAAAVTITYSANQAGTTQIPAETRTIDPGKSTVFSLNGTSKYVGSAMVTTGASNQQVVVVVNQTSTDKGTAYEGIPTSSATTSVSLPLLMANNGGFYTGVQCRNAGSTATTITLTYAPNTAGTYNPPAYVSTTTIAPNSNVNIQQGFTDKYVGGGTITTNPPTNVVCIVNELKQTAGSGDSFLTYNGINY